jgi:16S rRNA (guanine966-N2)-methyltransferase
MRITGGLYGGRILEAPKDRAIRPTSDKVRQAVFNMLNSRGVVENAVVLDAFCGTGALGIEALSWGASCCTFMDKNRGSLELCRRNFAALKINAQHYFVIKDAGKPGMATKISAANLVFLDPPYHQSLVETALPALFEGEWIAADCTILVETEKGWDPAVIQPLGYDVELTRDYGDTSITLARRVS